MLETIAIFYHEHNPLGVTEYRADTVSVHPDDPNTKVMVRKAIAYLLKFDKYGFSNCEGVTFHFDDETSLFVTCRGYEDGRARVLTVETVHQSPYYTDEPYRIDATTLRNNIYKRIGTLKEVAA